MANGIVTYSGLVVGETYYWTKGANEISFESGSTTLVASGGFIADDTQAVATGILGQAYTGTLTLVSTEFVPQKFVVYNRQVYVRATNGKIYLYGGTTNNVFDHTQLIVELPWLDLKQPSVFKQGVGLDVAMSGEFALQASMNPRASSYTEIINRGSPVSPSMVADSTFDVGHFGYSSHGTHIKIKALSAIVATAAKLGKISFMYNKSNPK